MPIQHEGKTLYTEEEVNAAKEAAVKERAKNHGKTVDDLEARATAAEKEAKANAKAAKEVEGLRAELGEARDANTLLGHGVSDEKGRRRLRQAYQADQQGVEEGKRASFDDWLKGDGAEDLARYAPAGDAGAEAAAGAAKPGAAGAEVGAKPATRTITTSAGARPAAGAAKMTPEIYQARTATLVDEYAAAKPADRPAIRAKQAALASEFAGQAGAAGAGGATT